jgi:riboflavin kinase/FMN adenylyltransferase
VNGAVSVGVFDGLHRGHLDILRRARERAGAGPLTVVSFDPHPDVVLAKSFHSVPPLTPLPEKRERLAALGVDRFEVLPFTRELAALDPETFVERHLVAPFAPKWLVVGETFALGSGRAGDVARLAAIGRGHGFQVEPVPLLRVGEETVSSTRIRALLGEGRVAEAAALLGRRYELTGRVVRGEAMGRELGYPTANLRLHEEKLVPANGIYAVWAHIAREHEWRAGAMSIGVRPTFGGQVRTLEVYLLDWDGDLYDRDLTVEMVDWLRPEERYDGADALIAQMRLDVAETRRRLAAAPARG